jgi:DnaJ-class molecular chaperone
MVSNIIGDVNLTLREKPHPTFTRSGNDLVHVAKISLLSALCGTTILVPTLDRRTLPIPLTDIIR